MMHTRFFVFFVFDSDKIPITISSSNQGYKHLRCGSRAGLLGQIKRPNTLMDQVPHGTRTNGAVPHPETEVLPTAITHLGDLGQISIRITMARSPEDNTVSKYRRCMEYIKSGAKQKEQYKREL
jgi:hypothetical protein